MTHPKALAASVAMTIAATAVAVAVAASTGQLGFDRADSGAPEPGTSVSPPSLVAP